MMVTAKNTKSAKKTSKKEEAKTKTSSKATTCKKTTKRKRAKVVMPKMTNLYKPAEMSLVEWQVALRQQQAEKELFAISEVDAQYCPGEFRIIRLFVKSVYLH